jgi:hypothetical protein
MKSTRSSSRGSPLASARPLLTAKRKIIERFMAAFLPSSRKFSDLFIAILPGMAAPIARTCTSLRGTVTWMQHEHDLRSCASPPIPVSRSHNARLVTGNRQS